MDKERILEQNTDEERLFFDFDIDYDVKAFKSEIHMSECRYDSGVEDLAKTHSDSSERIGEIGLLKFMEGRMKIVGFNTQEGKRLKLFFDKKKEIDDMLLRKSAFTNANIETKQMIAMMVDDRGGDEALEGLKDMSSGSALTEIRDELFECFSLVVQDYEKRRMP